MSGGVLARRLLIGGLIALAFAAPASAQRTTLMPGVTYEHVVQFTPHGPVALNVVVGPQPTGLYALQPVLSNNTITGRETLTSMEKRVASNASVVGVNGDFFTANPGKPTGMLMRGGPGRSVEGVVV